ncbi:MAG: DUF2384 domain-containing protein [Chryseobacterium sp.]|nr:DUF2384 domain-containing protein [Chryseobacterium sp.]
MYKNKISTSKEYIVSEPASTYRNTPVLKNFTTNDDYSLVKKAREGITTDLFYAFAETIKMPEKVLASVINLSPRTISNYRSQNKFLDVNYSEHLLKLINLYGLGIEIFGSVNEFNLWLEKPFYNSNEIPMDFLSTSGGVDLVAEEIEKLAQGYPL